MRALILSAFAILVSAGKTYSQYYNYYPLQNQNGNAYVVPVVVENNPNAYQLPGAFQVPDMSRISYEAGDQNAQAEKQMREFTSQAGAWSRIINNQKEMELRERQVALMERQARLQEEMYQAQMKQREEMYQAQIKRLEEQNRMSKTRYEKQTTTKGDSINESVRPDDPEMEKQINPTMQKYLKEINMLLKAVQKEVDSYLINGEKESIQRIKLGNSVESIFPPEDASEVMHFINQKIEEMKTDALSEFKKTPDK
jgi:hypothetical protein